MRHTWMRYVGRCLAMLLLTMASALLFTPSLQAAPHVPQAPADTITLTLENGPTFTYGQAPAPTFTAIVTFGTKPAGSYFWTVSGKTDDGATFSGSSPTSSPDGMTLTFSHMAASLPVKAGSRKATASFWNNGTNTTVWSNSVGFAVNGATTPLACTIDGDALHFDAIGQTLRIRMGLSPSDPGYVAVDWQNGTATVTFKGPTTFTFSNLVPDNNSIVTVPGISQKGKYLLGCTFSGTASFAPASYSNPNAYTFSAMQSPSSVQLFTNPTTLAANRNLDFYVVFHAVPGLPAPTGEFQIWIGQYYTDSMQLSANGDFRGSIGSLASLSGVSQITIKYWGDINYNQAAYNFPLTNPPIPGNAGSASTGGTRGTATATAPAVGTPGATQAADATQTAGATPSPATPPTGTNVALWLIGGLVVLLVLGGLGTACFFLLRARRAKWPPDAAGAGGGIPF